MPSRRLLGTPRAGRFKAAGIVFSTVLLGSVLGGCSTNLARLRECPEPGTARFEAIPIASRSEHEQALRFLPSDPDNCLVYVVRGRDFWTGAKRRRATVLLTPESLGVTPFPPDPSKLPLALDVPGRVREIHDRVYALWEVSPGNYALQAFLVADYGQLFIHGPKGVLALWPELQCKPGEVHFFAVGDRGFSGHAYLERIAPLSARESVDKGLRSAGVQTRSPGFRDCHGQW
jgi:hypothetical protein